MNENFQKPPGFALWILKKLVGDFKSRLLIDEFAEIYSEKIIKMGKTKAQVWFLANFTFSLISSAEQLNCLPSILFS